MDKDGAQKGSGSTFLIKVYFRQNNTWQGRIEWLEGEKSLPFRSLLEMVMLMEEALNQSGIQDQQIEFKTWTDKEDVS